MKLKPIAEGLCAWTILIFIGWIIFGVVANGG